jgi:hypothetical protein
MPALFKTKPSWDDTHFHSINRQSVGFEAVNNSMLHIIDGIGHFPKGVYFIKIETDNDEVARKLIKQ